MRIDPLAAATWTLPGLAVALVALWGPWTGLLVGGLAGGLLHVLTVLRVRRALAVDPTVAAAISAPWLHPMRALPALVDRRRAEQREAEATRLAGLRHGALERIWRSLESEAPVNELVAAVLDFFREQTRLREFAMLRLDPFSEELAGQWAVPGEATGSGFSVRWALGGVRGAVGRALRGAAPVHVFEEDSESVLLVNGDRPRPRAASTTYVVAPLLKPAVRPECHPQAWLFREGCPSHEAHASAAARGARRHSDEGVDLGACGRCRHFPLHGVLLATDAGRDTPLSDAERELVAGLATTVASVLDQIGLYRDVKAAERFREQVLDAMLNGLASTDHHGRIVFANRRAREFLGESCEPVGRRLEELVMLPAGSNALTRTLVEGVAYLQADATVRNHDSGDSIPVRVNLAPFRNEEGAMKGAVCVMEDRTQLRALEDELRHLDTLAAIGRFASSLAHEIRNPLAGIQAGIAWMGRSPRLGDEERENLSVMEREIRRTDDILRNLLGVASPREMVFARTDLVGEVEAAAEAYRALASEKSITIHSAGMGDATVHADRDQLQQVLSNLVKNAVEVSPQGGSVEVRVQASAFRDDQQPVRLEVLDRGPGIPEEDLPRLFEPFFSRKTGGTGLGLYVCHGIVERHGGHLRAVNRVDGGARFVVELPRTPALMGGVHEPAHSRSR